MPRPAPSYMFAHRLNPIKGWFDMAALDFSAKLSPNVTIEVHAGRVLHINAAGEFETGIAGTQMPIFAWNADYHYDVSNNGTTAEGTFMHEPILPEGDMSGLVATGSYELETSEFDVTPTVAYAPNQLLTAIVANDTQATGGVVSNDRAGAGGDAGAVRQYVDPVCGIVSRGASKNEHGVPMLAFWSLYLPAVFA